MEEKAKTRPGNKSLLVIIVVACLVLTGVAGILAWNIAGNIIYAPFFLYDIAQDWNTAPCGQHPALEEAENIIAENQALKQQVEAIGNVYVNAMESERCPDKAEIVIYYATVYERDKIKNMLGSTFSGVPYRLVNT